MRTRAVIDADRMSADNHATPAAMKSGHGKMVTRIGLLGAGNIARIIAKHQDGFRITGVFDRHRDRREAIAGDTGGVAYENLEQFLTGDFDVVAEAASVQAVQTCGEQILTEGKDLVVLSVGAFAEQAFFRRLSRLAEEGGRTIHIPSGAVFGLDNLKIGHISPLDHVTLRTTKPPASLKLETTERTCLFQGSAAECITRYPRNINVAVALGLAAEREVNVELWVDPAATHNIHEISIAGKFGEAQITVHNVPCPDNPSTSYLAALSIVTLLKRLKQPVIIGT
jgi:aspartate dehydrogenase